MTTRTLGNYTLSQTLGDTGLAVVFRGRGPDGREVAIKVLRRYFSQEQGLVEAFFRDLAPVQALRHPGIVAPLETGRVGDESWIVSEYVPWPSLRRALGHGPLPVAWSLRVLRGISEALEHAHAHGVVLGDLKPSNVFVSTEGGARLTDFGMAALAARSHPLVRGALSTPSPSYAAPEQLDGAAPTRPADVYALGAIAYEMLTGTTPYPDLAAATVVARQARERPPPPSARNPALPTACDWAFLRALAFAPDQRHASVNAFVADLEGALAAQAGSPVVPPPALTGPDPASAPAQPRADLVPVGDMVYCRSCGAPNVRGAQFCSGCWGKIGDTGVVTGEEVRRRLARVRLGRIRGRFALGVLAAVPLAALAVWGVHITVGLPGPNPMPISTVNAVQGPQAWALQGRDPAHTAFLETGPEIAGTVAWTYAAGRPLTNALAVAGGTVFVRTGDRRVTALNAQDGSVVWDNAATASVDTTPAVTEAVVYMGARDGRLVALDSKTGSELWSYRTGNPITATPTVSEGVVFVGGGDQLLHAVDAQTGRHLWTFRTRRWIHSTPVVRGGLVAVAGLDGEVYILDRADGRRLLSFYTHDPITSAPAFAGDILLVSTENGRLWAVNTAKREYPFERRIRAWRTLFFAWGLDSRLPVQKGFAWNTAFAGRLRVRGGGEDGGAPSAMWVSSVTVSAPAVAGDLAYVATSQGKVYAVELAAGRTRWQYEAGASASASSPVVVGGLVYVGTADGTVHVLDRETGGRVRTFSAGGPVTGQMAMAGDTLYHASRDGMVYAVR